MTHPERTLRFDWHSLPGMACLPGQNEGCRLRCVPASLPSATQHVQRMRNAPPAERKLALILTIAVWTLIASIAELIRLAGPLTPNV